MTDDQTPAAAEPEAAAEAATSAADVPATDLPTEDSSPAELAAAEASADPEVAAAAVALDPNVAPATDSVSDADLPAEIVDPASEVPEEVDLEALAAMVANPPSDARYQATGKRKTSVARVIVTPGDGSFWINGRTLEDYFPRHTLRTVVMEPLTVSGAVGAYHVRVRLHGGGISSQAGALRHGISKALSEIDPNVRTQLKKRGLLKLDARQVERKKAGLKKARKKPQFSKR